MPYAHTIVTGDTHMDWPALMKVLYHFMPEVCIVAGDFGWWPGEWIEAQINGQDERTLRWLLENKPQKTEIRFIDGNHEDLSELFARHRLLTTDPHTAVEFEHRLWFQPRGSTYELANGRKIFFCGGGKSVDFAIRRKGYSWFPEEIVHRDELPETLPGADLVISHIVPSLSGVFETMRPVKEVCEWWDDTPDETCATLDQVWQEIRPPLWIAAHLHLHREIEKEGTKFVVLDQVNGGYRPMSDFTYVLM